jgi:hypothetical protein
MHYTSKLDQRQLAGLASLLLHLHGVLPQLPGRMLTSVAHCLLLPQVAHAEGSPLLLCDTCPRSFHRACLGLAPAELPTGDWCCPKCVGSTQAALRRVVDLESRRREAGERAAQREKVGGWAP